MWKEAKNSMKKRQLVSAKLEAHAEKMAIEAFEDKSLPIVALVDKVERYAVKVEIVPAAKVNECIKDVFQGKFLKGLGDAVTSAVNELLGNTSAGEEERAETHIVFANNSLLRIDYYMYKYEFGSKGLREKFRNALCYVVQVGVLDNKKVDPQIALYELGKSIGQEKIEEASKTLEEDAKLLEQLYSVINRLRKASLSDQVATRPSTIKDVKQINASRSQPPKVSKPVTSTILPLQQLVSTGSAIKK
jgi:hypothetical protein